MNRTKLASKILVALVANPERYKDMKEFAEKHPQEVVTRENINKAYALADQFILVSRTKKPSKD